MDALSTQLDSIETNAGLRVPFQPQSFADARDAAVDARRACRLLLAALRASLALPQEQTLCCCAMHTARHQRRNDVLADVRRVMAETLAASAREEL